MLTRLLHDHEQPHAPSHASGSFLIFFFPRRQFPNIALGHLQNTFV